MRVYIPQIIPIFPLSTVVLFPKIHLPLHIFEPRYREMVQDILKGDRLIGIALLKEGWEEGYYQNPRVHLVGCIGKLIGYQALEDGRYNIILSGLTRFKIKEEFHDKSYRQAWVKTWDFPEKTPILNLKNRHEIDQLVQTHLKPGGSFPQLVSMLEKTDDETLIQALCTCLAMTPLEKQFLLESENINQQSRRLLELIKMKDENGNSKKEAKKPLPDSEEEQGIL